MTHPLIAQCAKRPLVMGIINVTPDSFSDGGRFVDETAVLKHAETMKQAGVDLFDVGGESTRPGAAPVTVEEELHRTLPVIKALTQFNLPISIDTSKPEVMRAAVSAGATIINDVRSLQLPGALEAAAELDVPVCLMHMQGQPETMQNAPRYDDVCVEVSDFFKRRIDACLERGVKKHNILLDPGFGFGKTLNHNLTLLKRLSEFNAFGLPLLVGLSRKSMLQTITGRAVHERLAGSIALALVAVQQGAHIVRVHDVAETVDALKVWAAVAEQPIK